MVIKRLLPRTLKDKLQTELQIKRLHRALNAFNPGQSPTDSDLAAVAEMWGDRYSAADVCLRGVADTLRRPREGLYQFTVSN
jgi:Cys-tRNA synthase (O-phospho-L-seryl-tRNA:Cys-tRNA synthase)